MRAVWKPKAGQVMARAVCFLSFIMEPSTLSVQTMKTRNPGVLQHLTMTLMACGDFALVSKLF